MGFILPILSVYSFILSSLKLEIKPIFPEAIESVYFISAFSLAITFDTVTLSSIVIVNFDILISSLIGKAIDNSIELSK